MRNYDINAVIFDFDGTLASCPYDFHQMREAVLLTAEEFGISRLALDGHEGLLETIASGAEFLVEEPERATAFRQEALASLADLEYQAAEYSVILPGIRTTLQQLSSLGFRLGVITRNSRAAVARIIGDTPLKVIDILCREDVPHPKPHADHALRMLQLLHATPANSLMVGDHPMDISIGRAAGMFTAAVLTGQSSEANLCAAMPDMLFPSVNELLAALVENNCHQK